MDRQPIQEGPGPEPRLGLDNGELSLGLTQLGWLTFDCVDFVLDHLDEWADWAETNLELPDTADS